MTFSRTGSSPATPITRRALLAGAAGAATFAAVSRVTGEAAARPPNGGPTAIVIGSGFGDAVAALRLDEAGISTTVLERGRRWIPVYSRAVGFGSSSTYHGLGGVVMNRAAGYDGAVHGYDNLYVVDGSFAPGAVGLVNPALTITALAERTMARFLTGR